MAQKWATDISTSPSKTRNKNRKSSGRSMLIPLDRHAYIRTVYNCAGTAHLCTCRECTGAQEGALLKNGILNPAINSLISRVRHTNTLVIADRGFPYWPQLETVDISLVDDMPRVLDVLQAHRQLNGLMCSLERTRGCSEPMFYGRATPRAVAHQSCSACVSRRR